MERLDPACGSGSFLLGAYEFLLNFHRDWYVSKGPKQFKDSIYEGFEGEWFLTIKEKKHILLNNIYGVDKDLQAVEVTKLSLLLKVLEGEKKDILEKQRKLWKERALPDLANNIKCGNSLIETDYYRASQTTLNGKKLSFKINAFEWKKEFNRIFDKGGFDVVIGNPPYIDSEEMVRSDPELREYCTENNRYQSAKGNWDIFCIFIEKGMKLLKKGGLISLIVPNKLLSADYSEGIRDFMSRYSVRIIRDYSRVKVFPVAVYPIVFVAELKESRKPKVIIQQMESPRSIGVTRTIPSNKFYNDINWSKHFSEGGSEMLDRIINKSIKLEEIAEVFGAATVSEAYEIKEILKETKGKESEIKFVNTGTIDRYAKLWGRKSTTYIKQKFDYPVVLKSDLKRISKKRLDQALSEKLIIAGMCKRIECCYDTGIFLAGKSTIVVIPKEINPLILLGIINSSLMSYFYKAYFRSLSLQGGYMRFGPPQIKKLPIINFEALDTKDKEHINQLKTLVQNIQKLNDSLLNETIPNEREKIKRAINSIDQEIDKYVHMLYGLSKKEIDIINKSLST